MTPREPFDGGRADRAPSLDDVRDELRALGYLRDPIAGLLAPHSAARATFIRASLLTSLRTGLLGGAILAAPLALALARLSRPHVQGGHDLTVLALYLLPLVAMVLASMNLIGDLFVRLLSGRRSFEGRGERIAVRFGAMIGGASSLYLALLWGRQSGRDVHPWSLALEILIIAAAGWLVGWIMRGGALFVVAAIGGRMGSAGRARASGPVLLAAVAGALSLLLGALLTPHAAPPRPMPPLAGREVPGRLIVVGVDGVDAAWLASLLSRVDVPTLREIARRGVSWTLRPDGAAVPPEAWTTFATGVPGEVHGIRSYEVRRLPGMRSPLLAGSNEPAVSATLGSALRLLAFLGPRAPATPLSSGLRRSRAIWELMSAAGSTAAVINWWATWPADAEGGLTVSDRAFGAFLFRAKSGSPVEAAEGGREAAAGGIKDDALVQPAALLHELESEFPDRWKSIEARYAALVRGGAAGSSLPEAHEAFLIDAYHLEIADRILEERKPHGLFVYLPGQDIILGSVAGEGRAHPAAGGGDAAGRLDEALKTVSSQEILLAELESGLSRFVARMSPSDIIVLLFDPGRFFREEKGEATRGQLFLFGDRIQASGPRGEAGALDVAPTLLTLAGLPLSRELPGRPVGDLSTLVSGLPDVGFVPNYGDRPEGVAGPEGSDDFLDRLRSLGYIQ